MNSSQALMAGALVCAPGIKAQIRTMHERDRLSVEEIAQALELSPELVEYNLRPAMGSSMGLTQTAQQPNSNRAEELLAPLQERAAERIGELIETAESEAVALHASIFVMETAAGLKRPRVETTIVNNNEINIMIQQATEAYKEQMKAIEV